MGVYVASMSEAMKAIRSHRYRFCRVLIHPRIDPKRWTELIEKVHLHQLGAGVLLLDETHELERPVLNQLTNAGVSLVSSKLACEMVSEAIPDLEKAVLSRDRRPLPSAVEDGYVALRAIQLLRGGPLPFDLYLKIQPTRFLRLFHRTDSIELPRLVRYVNRGLEFLYVERGDHEVLLERCAELREVWEQRSALRFKNHLYEGEQIERFLRENTDAKAVAQAVRFVRSMGPTMAKYRLNDDPVVRAFLEDIRAYEHGVAVATVALMMVPFLFVPSVMLQRIVALTGLFHDLGLKELGIDQESIPDLDRLERHPQMGADRLKSAGPSIPDAVIMGIEQHHERQSGSGYPRRKRLGGISRIGELIGLSDVFVDCLNQAGSYAEALRRMKQQELLFFSNAVGDAFVSAFDP
jgi:hypothetical protein